MKQEAIIIHPGEVLREDFLLPLKLTPEKLVNNIKVSPQIIQELISKKKRFRQRFSHSFSPLF